MNELHLVKKERFAVDEIDMEIYLMEVYVDQNSGEVRFYVGEDKDLLCVPEPRYTFYEEEQQAREALTQCKTRQEKLCREIKEKLQGLYAGYRYQDGFDLHSLFPEVWLEELSALNQAERVHLNWWKQLGLHSLITLGSVSFRRDEVLRVEWGAQSATVHTAQGVYTTDGEVEFSLVRELFG